MWNQAGVISKKPPPPPNLKQKCGILVQLAATKGHCVCFIYPVCCGQTFEEESNLLSRPQTLNKQQQKSRH